MYLLISDFIEGVQGPIPSLVWFESAQEEAPEFGGNGRLLPADVFRCLFLGKAKGELRVLGRPNPSDDANCVIDGVIEGGAEIPDDIKGHGAEVWRDFLIYSRLKESFARCVITLCEFGVRLPRVEGIFDDLKFGNVFFCSADQ